MNRQACVLLTAVLAGSTAAAANVVLEAESAAAIEAPMRLSCATHPPPAGKLLAESSGGAYLEIPDKAGNPPALTNGLAVFRVNLPVSGNWTLWVRAYWENECGNSVTVRIDDQPPFILGEDGTYRVWHWVKYPVARMTPPIALSAGSHVIRLENREDGIRIDQLALSNDRRFVPVDAEAVTTSGGAP